MRRSPRRRLRPAVLALVLLVGSAAAALLSTGSGLRPAGIGAAASSASYAQPGSAAVDKARAPHAFSERALDLHQSPTGLPTITTSAGPSTGLSAGRPADPGPLLLLGFLAAIGAMAWPTGRVWLPGLPLATVEVGLAACGVRGPPRRMASPAR